MIKNLQIFESLSFNPYINLGIEKFLFENLEEDTIILYLWQNEKTVVIGKNQNPYLECRCSALENDGGFVARRLSGGGAVFHDIGNLNFTFICKKEDYDLEMQTKVIENACRQAGIDVRVSGRNDILADGRKFSGNAFFNKDGKVCRHGTIMISANAELMSKYLTPPKAKLESKGVKSVKSRVVNLKELNPSLTIDEMKKDLCIAFSKIYNLESKILPLPDHDIILKYSEEFKDRNYIYSTSFPFTFSCETRFDWGNIQLFFQVQKGIITQSRVYTDSMDSELSEKLQNAFSGCGFTLESIKKATENSVDKNIAEDIVSLLESEGL